MIPFKADRSVFPMPAACLMAVVVLSAACAQEDTKLKDPELACQTMKCICVEPDHTTSETPKKALVLWAENGDAHCPEGLELRRAAPKDNDFLKRYGG